MGLVHALHALLPWFCLTMADARGAEYVVPPFQHTMFCHQYPAECLAGEGTQPSLSDPEKIRHLQQVNSSVNKAIASIQLPQSPLNRWSIFPSFGLCGDYAVTKRHVLRSWGWPSSDLLLAEVVVRHNGERHLILIASTSEEYWVLDNLLPEAVSLEVAVRLYWFLRIESSDEPQYWKSPPRLLRSLAASRHDLRRAVLRL
jgi:predicted transglutaminase-like cysteine proteinase